MLEPLHKPLHITVSAHVRSQGVDFRHGGRLREAAEGGDCFRGGGAVGWAVVGEEVGVESADGRGAGGLRGGVVLRFVGCCRGCF